MFLSHPASNGAGEKTNVEFRFCNKKGLTQFDFIMAGIINLAGASDVRASVVWQVRVRWAAYGEQLPVSRNKQSPDLQP